MTEWMHDMVTSAWILTEIKLNKGIWNNKFERVNKILANFHAQWVKFR